MSSRVDQLRILRHLTFSRVMNLLRLRWSYKWSKWTKKAKHNGMPFALSIEPTTACNLGCPECPSGLRSFSRPTGNLHPEKAVKWMDELSPSLFYLNFYFQGEPFIHPRFMEIVKEAKKRKIYVATSSNGHFFSEKKAREVVESGLDRLIISIDGTTQETYEQYRIHGELSKVIEGTKNILQAKKTLRSKTPHVIFQFLVVKPNEHQVPEVFQLAKDLGVDEVRLKTAQVYDFENGNPLIPENPEYTRYRKGADGKWRIRNKFGNHCWRMWSSSVLTWDGKVVPCCFDKDATHQMGDLAQQNFRTIWRSTEYKNFRQAILSDRSQIEICRNCSEGSKVWTN
jgi:radical SAM protein with 4Fe4S-binding SPASM domain